MIHEHVTIDTDLTVLRSGISHPDPSEASCTTYVVLDRAECERFFGNTLRTERSQTSGIQMAEELTGWRGFDGGPGRAFAADPVYRVYGRKVLVTQYRGLDI